jgi:hypothetical protein
VSRDPLSEYFSLLRTGVHYPSSSAETATELVVEPFNNALEGQGDQTDMGWQNLSLMFDPAYFLSMTHGDL